MQVSLRQRGGLFGLDRKVRVDRRGLSVREGGKSSRARLSDEEFRHVEHLAARVVEAHPTTSLRRGTLPPDGMLTDLEIRDDHGRRVVVCQGDRVGLIFGAEEAVASLAKQRPLFPAGRRSRVVREGRAQIG